MSTKISNGIKIAVSSTGKDLNNKIAEVFGRCPYFIIAEIESQKIKKTEAVKNENNNQMSGVGVLTAQLLAEKNIKAVITKNVGPRAMDVLKQFNIAVYSGSGVIKEALQEFIEKKLKKIN